MTIAAAQVTGLVLAGGQAQRMGGADKGLLPYRGEALALHALRRLRSQVGPLAISANRNAEVYAAFGVPVWADDGGGFCGPLAGVQTAFARCTTPYVACVPCDAPLLPLDLVERLVDALQREGTLAAIAATRHADGWQPQPVFCLLHRDLAASLARFLQGSRRSVAAWLATTGFATAHYDDAAAFANVNTPDELRALHDGS